MSDLKERDLEVLKLLAEVGPCTTKQLRGFVTDPHNFVKLTTPSMKISLDRLEKAGLTYKYRKGVGQYKAPRNIRGGYAKGAVVAHRWAVTEDGRLLSGFNPPT